MAMLLTRTLRGPSQLGLRSFSTTPLRTTSDFRAASARIFTPAEISAGITALTEAGYDAGTVWEQRVVWGDHDQFQHVNNVHFVRWFESARMFYAETLTKSPQFTEERRKEILRGTGRSFILAGINVRYRRPVVYPDTVSSISVQQRRKGRRADVVLRCERGRFSWGKLASCL